MAELFYLQDSRNYVGNDILWWGRNGCGYTTNLMDAEVYTKEEALSQHRSRISDIPWPKKYIDGKTRPAVDMQYACIKEALKGTGVKLTKPKKKRPTTGQERIHCGRCGKIFWSYNPYQELCDRRECN